MTIKPEQTMWNRVSASLQSELIMQRVEDRLSPDIPDVNFVRRADGSSGWIELKTIPNWMKKKPTRVPHLTAGQVNWLNIRGRVGASVWLLLWVRESNDWLWIHGASVDHSMWDEGLPKEGWEVLSRPYPFT